MKRQSAVDESVRHLSELGFTELEATVYAYLVEHAPATAYRAAQGIGKPVANTYQAVKSLQQKGAVLVDETGENRLCRAVPPAELLHEVRRRFERREGAAARALARLQPASGDEGVFTMAAPDQVFGRCARMLEDAEDVLLLDAFPGAVGRLRPALEAAATRGVTVVVQAYAPVELRGVEVVVQPGAPRTLERWPGQWLSMVADGAEYLLAYMDPQGESVHQAIWSASPLLAWVHHSYLAGSARDHLLTGLLESATDVEALRAALARTERWFARDARGYRRLQARFGDGEGADEVAG